MEKIQLIELMDSAIELDDQLSEWMSEEEARLAEHAEMLDKKLPVWSAQRMSEFEASFADRAIKARAEMDEATSQIVASQAEKLRIMQERFQMNRTAMVDKVFAKIRGDRLD